MKNIFREKLLENNLEFKNIFNELIKNNEIREFSTYIWAIISKDKTPIKVNSVPYAFKDIFHLNLNEGNCRYCAFELVLLLDKLGIYSEAVECVNKFFIGTVGSSYGGHYYVEAHIDEEIICFDTSLVIEGTKESFNKLGHTPIRKYSIDDLFMNYPELIDHYESMLINKINL